MKLSINRHCILGVLTIWLCSCTHLNGLSNPTTVSNDQGGANTPSFDAVKITIRQPGGVITGGGVWVGEGKVLTALHLFSNYAKDDSVVVAFGNHIFPAKPLFHGHLPDLDLALLELAAPIPMTQHAPTVCGELEPVGAQLYVAAHDRGYQTYASPDGQITYQGKTWANSTTTLFSHGVSGSPLYDQGTGCLAGIISKIDSLQFINHPETKACLDATRQLKDHQLNVTCGVVDRSVFVTADVIARFLSEARRFLDDQKQYGSQ